MTNAQERARELLQSRLAVIADLETAAAARDRDRDALETSEKAFTRAYAGALKAGWSDEELRQIGLVDGRKPAGRRRRKATPAVEKSASESPSTDAAGEAR
jgi:hypothetical protein